MGVMSKMASMEGLSPGLAVVVMKTPEFFYVIYSIIASCVPSLRRRRSETTASDTIPSISSAAHCLAEMCSLYWVALRSSDITKATWAAASTKGCLLMAFGGLSNILGTTFFNRAMQKGSAAAITGLSACYPAVTLLLAVVLIRWAHSCFACLRNSHRELDTTACNIPCAQLNLRSEMLPLVFLRSREKINKAKVLGILLAAGSGIAFSKA